MIGIDEVTAAAQRIRGWVRQTPLFEVDSSLAFKLEYLQASGSFKARGAFNRLLAAKEQGGLSEAVSASGGNAALAVAYAGVKLGIPVTVFVPQTAPAVKVAKLKALGANVNQAGQEYAAAFEAAQEYVVSTGALFCHAYDQPEVVAGAGTVGLELEDGQGRPYNVVVSVGGGGLIAGVAAALEGTARVIGAEPSSCPTLHAALEAGAPVDVSVSGIAADSLGARRVGEIAFAVAARTGVSTVLVTEAEIISARQALWDNFRIVVEHGAAAAYAAYLRGGFEGRTIVVLCGANTDPADL